MKNHIAICISNANPKRHHTHVGMLCKNLLLRRGGGEISRNANVYVSQYHGTYLYLHSMPPLKGFGSLKLFLIDTTDVKGDSVGV